MLDLLAQAAPSGGIDFFAAAREGGAWVLILGVLAWVAFKGFPAWQANQTDVAKVNADAAKTQADAMERLTTAFSAEVQKERDLALRLVQEERLQTHGMIADLKSVVERNTQAVQALVDQKR